MNLSKHMEFVFVGALALAGITAAATAAAPKLLAPSAPSVRVASASTNAVPTVVVKAKRLSAKEKATLAE